MIREINTLFAVSIESVCLLLKVFLYIKHFCFICIFHLSTYSCPHHYLNFDDDYLTAKAADTLVVLPTAVGAALMLYETAVQANPFNARNFAGASLLSVQNGDSVKAAYYLNEGLLIDPENKGLQALLNVWKGGHK